MLPPANRLRRPADFDAAVRGGVRARSGAVVVHHLVRPDARSDGDVDAPRVGLVVSKQVGGSVVRHRVARRLRAQLAPRLGVLPAGSATVVRALPPAAEASSAHLGADLDRALARVTRSSGSSSRSSRPATPVGTAS